MLSNFYGNNKYPNVTGPHHWQDPDMMVVGMSGLTVIEWRTHFSLWVISAAPLWIGIDLRDANTSAKEILLNTEAIAVDQDVLGHMGESVDGFGNQVYLKRLQANSSNGESIAAAMVVFNVNDTNNATFDIDFTNMNVNGGGNVFNGSQVNVRDLWMHKDLGLMGSYMVNLVPHDCVLLRLWQ